MPALPIHDMGPCEIIYGYGESNAIALGPFLGATVLKGETGVEDIQEERYGEAAVDAIMTGTVVTMEMSMTRSTYAQLAEALNTTTAGDVLYLRNQLGCEMYDSARPLLIQPICDGVPSDDPASWVLLYKAFIVPGWELTWDRSTQRVFPLQVKVFVSQESGETGKFGQLGVEEESGVGGVV